MGDNATVKECRECLAGRPHCHGTLIHHRGEKAQCTEPDCTHPEVLLHSLVVDCDAIGCPCGEHWDHQLASYFDLKKSAAAERSAVGE